MNVNGELERPQLARGHGHLFYEKTESTHKVRTNHDNHLFKKEIIHSNLYFYTHHFLSPLQLNVHKQIIYFLFSSCAAFLNRGRSCCETTPPISWYAVLQLDRYIQSVPTPMQVSAWKKKIEFRTTSLCLRQEINSDNWGAYQQKGRRQDDYYTPTATGWVIGADGKNWTCCFARVLSTTTKNQQFDDVRLQQLNCQVQVCHSW